MNTRSVDRRVRGRCTWSIVALVFLLVASAWVRWRRGAQSTDQLVFWETLAADPRFLEGWVRCVAALECLLAAGLLLRRTRMLAIAMLVIWNTTVALGCVIYPGAAFETAVLSAAPLTTLGAPGVAQLVGWLTLLLALWSTTKTAEDPASQRAVARHPSQAFLALLLPQVSEPIDPGGHQATLHVTSFSHADVRYSDLQDLAQLAPVFDGVDVVILGEIHRDGSAYALKSRLVRYLHESLGFDVLAWEAPILQCDALRKLLSDGIVPSATGGAAGVGPPWASSPYMQPLFDYVMETQRSDRPLTVVGLDCKFEPRAGGLRDGSSATGIATDTWGRLLEFLRTRGAADAALDGHVRTLESLVAAASDCTYPRDDLQRREVHAAIASLRAAAGVRSERDATRLSGDLRVQSAERVLAAAESLDAWLGSSVGPDALPALLDGSFTNPRDRFMADTLMWYRESVFPGKKVIVWTGGIHGIADPGAILPRTTAADEPSEFAGANTLAQIVKSRLGPACRVVATTSLGGVIGSRENPQLVRRPDSGSLEHVLELSDATFGLADLRGLAGASEGISTARILSGVDLRFDIQRAVDGVLFSRRSFPERPLSREFVVAQQAVPDSQAVQPHACRESVARAESQWRRDCQSLKASLELRQVPVLLGLASHADDSDWCAGDAGSALPEAPDAPVLKRYSLAPVVGTIEHSERFVLLERGSTPHPAFLFRQPSVLVSVTGDVGGDITFRSAALLRVQGDLTADVACTGITSIDVAGRLRGRLLLQDASVVRLAKGIADGGRVECRSKEVRIYLGGHTSRAALDSVVGPATVIVEASDLGPGRHVLGELEIEVDSSALTEEGRSSTGR